MFLRASFWIFVVALAVRLIFLVESSKCPTFYHPISDAGTYDRMARQFQVDHKLTDEFFWQPFLYPAILSALYSISGSSILFAKIFQILLGALTCSLTYQLGRKICGRRVGLMAGLAAALYGPFIFSDAELVATVWASFWTVVLLLLCLRLEKGAGVDWWLLFGVCGALAVLTRPTFLPFIVAAMIWIGIKRWRDRENAAILMAKQSLCIAVFLLTVLPVAYLSHSVAGARTIFPTSDGLNLYIGNNPKSDMTVAVRPGWDWDSLTRLPMMNGVTKKSEASAFFRRQVMAYVKEQPGDFFKGMMKKKMQFISSRELPRNEDVYVMKKWSWLLKPLVWKIGGVGFPFVLVLPLALVGGIYCFKRIPISVYLFVMLYAAGIILVFASARYRLPMVPVLLVLAGAGVDLVVKVVRERLWKHMLAVAGICILMVAVMSVPGPFPQEKADYEAEMYYCLGAQQIGSDLKKAQELLEKAVAISPDYADAHNSLGVVWERNGDLKRAGEEYSNAIRLEPENATAHKNLGLILERNQQAELAIGQYLEAIRIDPNQPLVHAKLGVLYGRMGRLAESEAYLRSSLLLDSGQADVHCNLGTTLAFKGDRDGAISEYKRALELNPAMKEAQQGLDEVLKK